MIRCFVRQVLRSWKRRDVRKRDECPLAANLLRYPSRRSSIARRDHPAGSVDLNVRPLVIGLWTRGERCWCGSGGGEAGEEVVAEAGVGEAGDRVGVLGEEDCEGIFGGGPGCCWAAVVRFGLGLGGISGLKGSDDLVVWFEGWKGCDGLRK
jgi:hypothetical protein